MGEAELGLAWEVSKDEEDSSSKRSSNSSRQEGFMEDRGLGRVYRKGRVNRPAEGRKHIWRRILKEGRRVVRFTPTGGNNSIGSRVVL